jgi:hypothetical protein
VYSNIPVQKTPSSSNQTVTAFDTYFSQPLELSVDVLSAIEGFFAGSGFDEVSSKELAVIIMKQAKKDGYNPMQILDTLKGLDTIEISALVAEILNNNRFKTSFLGYALAFVANEEVKRNILA